METLLLILLGSLGILFIWGLFSPRSQWRVLVSWSYRDPHANEPTGFAYGLYRVVAALGIATMVVSGVLVNQVRLDNTPPPPVALTATQQMWGTPEPVVVNRVVHSSGTVSAGLVDQPILGYQSVVGQTRQPPYLFRLTRFSMESATTENGFIGSDPATGLAALDTAWLVVAVAGDPLCFPHQAVVIESAKSVRVGVYYGQENPADGSNAENLGDCNTRASGASVSALLPITLVEPLGDRVVLTLDGDAIRRVALIR